jgi:Domain of unknown function (DUF929)
MEHVSPQKSRPRQTPRTPNPTRVHASTRSQHHPAAGKPGHKPTQSVIREREAAKRALAEASGRRTVRRRRATVVFAPIAAVVLAVTALIAVKLATDSGPASGKQSGLASTIVVNAVTAVPQSVLDEIGVGSVNAWPTKINDSGSFTDGGKPRVLYVGADYCPFCASQRWPLVVALSRFGTWHNLGVTNSAPAPESYPNTASLSFHGTTYTSDVISFTGVELRGNQVVNGQYNKLDTLSTADTAVMTRYDSAGSIPFIDLGGLYVHVGGAYDVAVLGGLSHEAIATALADPTSAIAKAVNGEANVITAALCAATGNKPAAVCSASGVVAATEALASHAGS